MRSNNVFVIVINLITVFLLAIFLMLAVVAVGTWLMRAPSMIFVIIGFVGILAGIGAIAVGACYILYHHLIVGGGNDVK